MSELGNVKNILIALNEEGEGRPSDALGYGLALGKAAGAHISVQAASVKLDIPSAHGSAVVARLVHEENRRIQELTRRIADNSRAEGAMAGVICEVDAPQLTDAELKSRALAQARVNDVIVRRRRSQRHDGGRRTAQGARVRKRASHHRRSAGGSPSSPAIASWWRGTQARRRRGRSRRLYRS